MSPPAEAVPALDELTPAEFNRHYHGPSRPVLLRGAARRWRAFGRWSPESFVALFGDRPVELAESDGRGFDYTFPTTRRMSFREAAELIAADRPESAQHYYLLKQNIRAVFPELEADLDAPPWLDDPTLLTSVNLWFGGAGNLTPLHYDRSNNFLVQLFGRKHVTLCDPSHFDCLYPALDSDRPHISRADITRRDDEAFPLLSQARPVEVLLAPGDVLYLPPYWWHQVRSLDQSISVNYWWRAHVSQCACPAGVYYLPLAYDAGAVEQGLADLDRRGTSGLADVARRFVADYPWVSVLLGATWLEQLLRRRAGEQGVALGGADGPERLGEIASRLERDGAGTGLAPEEMAGWIALAARARQKEEGGIRSEEAGGLLDRLEASTLSTPAAAGKEGGTHVR
jgi:lysine-specific demethylase 8